MTRGRYALLRPCDAVGTVPILHLFTRRQPITNNETQSSVADESNPIVSEMQSESQANQQGKSDEQVSSAEQEYLNDEDENVSSHRDDEKDSEEDSEEDNDNEPVIEDESFQTLPKKRFHSAVAAPLFDSNYQLKERVMTKLTGTNISISAVRDLEAPKMSVRARNRKQKKTWSTKKEHLQGNRIR